MLPDGYNWLDVAIGLILVAALIRGIKAGLIRSIFSIAGIAAGLALAIACYARGSAAILEYLSLPQFMADALAFILVFSLAAGTVHFIGSIFAAATRFSLFRFADKLGGSAAGLVIGAALVGVLLILFTAFPIYADFQEHVDQSFLAPPLVDSTYLAYEGLSGLLPVDLPLLTVFPEELSGYLGRIGDKTDHGEVNYEALDGATCFVCEGEVSFAGYLGNGKGSVSPRFICTRCGRTSDGCQTYEGYHEMYGQCPVDLGRRGYRLDCGIWSNHSYHRPLGPCAVCETD